jgi:hypothetical protein
MTLPIVLTPELMAKTEYGVPEWIRKKRSVQVWLEDDATISHMDHENLEGAWKRLVPSDSSTEIATWDDGDAIFRLYSNGYIRVASFPGNSSIRKLIMEVQL